MVLTSFKEYNCFILLKFQKNMCFYLFSFFDSFGIIS